MLRTCNCRGIAQFEHQTRTDTVRHTDHIRSILYSSSVSPKRPRGGGRDRHPPPHRPTGFCERRRDLGPNVRYGGGFCRCGPAETGRRGNTSSEVMWCGQLQQLYMGEVHRFSFVPQPLLLSPQHWVDAHAGMGRSTPSQCWSHHFLFMLQGRNQFAKLLTLEVQKLHIDRLK